MKKTIKFIVKVIVAAIVAGGMACVLIAHDASDNVVLGTYFFGAIGVAAVLGVFDMPERKERKHQTISEALRQMREAA